MAISAFIAKVPAAESLVGDLRRRSDATVALGNANDADAAATQLRAGLLASGAVHTHCASVALIESSSGRWQDLHIFQLPEVGSILDIG
jgi:hypothetical protein